ncbi:uncharacterized protein [Pleurodeles waltl]|uniref:uncharacterized protein n=1 Tax=Pleurodeles waltl TaxID=8319 RepID=UPI0037098832
MLDRPRLGRMGEEELGAFIWLVCHFLHLMLEAGGRVIQGYHTEARRLRWSKVLFRLKRVFNSQRYQLKHHWAGLVAREKDLLDHLGVVIGGPVGGPAPYTIGEVARFADPDISTANMNAHQIRAFQKQTMRYCHILDVESGFRNMAQRYRHERATGVWRAFAQGGPSLPTTATTTSTTTPTTVAQRMTATVAGPSTSSALGPQTAAPAPPPPRMARAPALPSTSGTQTTSAAVIDNAEFQQMRRDMQRMLRRMDRLQQEVSRNSRRLRGIKKILRRAKL